MIPLTGDSSNGPDAPQAESATPSGPSGGSSSLPEPSSASTTSVSQSPPWESPGSTESFSVSLILLVILMFLAFRTGVSLWK